MNNSNIIMFFGSGKKKYHLFFRLLSLLSENTVFKIIILIATERMEFDQKRMGYQMNSHPAILPSHVHNDYRNQWPFHALKISVERLSFCFPFPEEMS